MVVDDRLADLLQCYGFSITHMQTVGSISSPWRNGADGRMTFDASGHWREVVLQMQREMRCERCGGDFAYTFQVLEEGHVYRGHTPSYTELTRALEHELRRAIRCPYCHTRQRRIRRMFFAREQHHALIGSLAIGGSMLGTTLFIFGGYMLAGMWGLIFGALLALGLVIKLTQWMLVYTL